MANSAANTHDRVRELILAYGWNSTCYQLLNPGFEYWFSSHRDAVTAYVEYSGTRVVGGSPVCDFSRLPDVVDEFESDSRTHGFRVSYFATEARLESVIAKRDGYSILQLGAQPVWEPTRLVRNMHEKSSLRGQLHRAFNKGIIVEEWPPEKASDHPALKKLLQHWLQTRGLPSLHFLVEPDTLSQLKDRRIFVAAREGIAVGFLNVSPIPERHGWLIEQFVRGPDAPNGTVELMLHKAAETLAEEQYAYLTLGLSPLTRHGTVALPQSPKIIRALLQLARAHGKRFYNFEGLEFFKTKFEPDEWEPIFAISKEKEFSIWSLLAIAGAFTKGRPFRTAAIGVAKAVGEEFRRFFKR